MVDGTAGDALLPGDEPQDEEFSFLPDTDDVLLFAPRGAEKLVRSVVSLASFGNYGQHDPDKGLFVDRFAEGAARVAGAKDPRFRTSSFLGALGESAVQFAAPFTLATKGLQAVGFLSGARLNAVLAAKNVHQAGLTGIGLSAARAATAGAIADFVAFDAHEGRLSDLLNEVPALAPLVPDFLTSDKEDPELLGRMKNVIEGAGLGFAVDTILGGIRAIRFARHNRRSGQRRSAELARIEQEVGEQAKPTLEAARAIEDDAALTASMQYAGDPPTVPKSALEQKKRFVKRGQQQVEIRGARNEVQEALRRRKNRMRSQARTNKRVEKDVQIREALEKDETGNVVDLLHEKMRLTPEFTERALAHFDRYTQEEPKLLEIMGGDPNKIPKKTKELLGMALSGGLNLSQYVDVDPGMVKLVRALEKTVEESMGIPLKQRKSDPDAVLEALARMQEDLGFDPPQTARYASEFLELAEEVEVRAEVNRINLMGLADRAIFISDMLKNQGRDVTPDDLRFYGLVGAARRGQGALEAEWKSTIEALGLQDLGHARGISSVARTMRGQQRLHSTDLLEMIGLDPESTAPLAGIGRAEFEKRVEMVASLRHFSSRERLSALQRLRKMREQSPGRLFRLTTAEWVTSALLHSPKTWATNAVFPFVHAFWVPIEGMIGGSLVTAGRGLAGRGEGATEAWQAVVDNGHLIGAMLSTIPEAARMARRAFSEGPIFNPNSQRRDLFPEGTGLLDRENLMSVWGNANAKGWSLHNSMVSTLGWLGTGVGINLPGKIMRSTDEFVKVMSGMALARTRLSRMAKQQGVEAASFIQESLPKMFDDGRAKTEAFFERKALDIVAMEQREGMVKQGTLLQRRKEVYDQLLKEASFEELNPVVTEARQFADEVTSTTPVDPETLAGKIKPALRADPLFRIMIPFYSTPVNLLKSAGQRLDGAFSVPATMLRKYKSWRGQPATTDAYLRNTRDLMSGDTQKVTMAVGRLATGAGLFMTVTGMVRQGLITGSGPADPERRRAMMDAGWLPYSIHDGSGGYYQYIRADPAATILGVIADAYETAKMLNEEEGEEEFESVLMGSLFSIAENVTSRSYLAGIAQFIDAVNRPERGMEKLVGNLAVIGVPRTIQQLAPFLEDDPVLRENYALLDKIRRKLPLLSEGAPPMRNVLGDPIDKVSSLGAKPKSTAGLWFDFFSPIAYREVGDDVLKKEFAELSYGFTPPKRQRLGVDLTDHKNARGQSAHDRWAQLHGKVRIGERNLRQALRSMINNPDYQKLTPKSTIFEASPRVRLLRNTINQYRRAAWEETLREFPNLAAEYRRRQEDQRLLRAGGLPGDLIERIGL